MRRSLTFKLRINQEERSLLALVAKQLKRSQADTIRFLLKNAAQDLKPKSDGLVGTDNQYWGRNNE